MGGRLDEGGLERSEKDSNSIENLSVRRFVPRRPHLILSRPGCLARATPELSPLLLVGPGGPPVITLSAPAGKPALLASSANMMQVMDERGDGLRTMEHPAARAGATLTTACIRGKFQGVIIPTTPGGGEGGVSDSNCIENPSARRFAPHPLPSH